ncbi:MAG: ATP-dependent Clp protease adaptor ClpS [Ignavibacteriales bacterium]|nr:MAG: ATP-dependent Clp protease adaptor ClpS [Ignavibacteriales bacterium]
MQKRIDEKPEIDILVDEETTIDVLSRVVLYNDDWHTFDEVIIQLIKAISCTFETARSHAFEVHVKGKSIVFNGSLKDCLRVSTVLEEIALNTQIIT